MQDIQDSTSRFFRIHPGSATPDQIHDLLAAQAITSLPVPFWPFARQLEKAPFAFGRSLAALFGYLYIQDPSSMLPPLVLSPLSGSVALDLCASPGGKTGILSQLVGPTGLVVANEPNPNRRATLQANMMRQNLTNVVLTGYLAEQMPLAEESWPFILLDAPCSGWGTEKKNPLVKKLWTREKTVPLVSLQRQLLRRAARLLAPGGRLVYSTCTTNERENEEQISWALSELGLEPEPLAPFSGFVFEEQALKDGLLLVDGSRCQAQGFFIACLRKPGDFSGLPDQPCDLPGTLYNLDEICPVPAGMGPGKALVVNDNVFFAGDQARSLLGGSRWQGYLLGRFKKGRFAPHPQARCLLPVLSADRIPDAERFIFEDTADIENILTGTSLSCSFQAAHIPFYWKNLPLGWLRRKGQRCIWTGRS